MLTEAWRESSKGALRFCNLEFSSVAAIIGARRVIVMLNGQIEKNHH